MRISRDSRLYRLGLVLKKFASIFSHKRKHESMTKIKTQWAMFKAKTKATRLIQNLRKHKKETKALEEEEDL